MQDPFDYSSGRGHLSLEEVGRMANTLRLDVVQTVNRCGDGHPGPAMSIAEIIALLYFREMKIDPAHPQWPQRDRFVLSKGHACPILYAALARRGYFPLTDLPGLRTLQSHLQGHPDMNKTPGIDMITGSLGHGISTGLGMALATRYQGYASRVYVITGDGELEEGLNWEAAMAAAHFKAGNLTVLVDVNHMQSGGEVSSISSLYPLIDKFAAFGWHCQKADGHDVASLQKALDEARRITDRPSLIGCHTIKGKGIPYMEGDNSWHKKVPSDEQVLLAMQALEGKCL